jgi:branched-chain amino acid transport system substrate-binding protein
MKKGMGTLAVLAAALAFGLPAALGGAAATTPGVTAHSILLGGTFPLTGAASSYAPIPRGMQAFFSYINARKGPDGKRGVGGRQIIWKYYDDAYNPTQTVQQTQRLVEQDKVFALVGGLGTEPQQAVRDYLQPEEGSTALRVDRGNVLRIGPQEVPVDDRVAARLPVRSGHLRPVHPRSHAEREGRGALPERRLRQGLQRRVRRRSRERQLRPVVATRTFNVTDPAVTTQLVALRASGADTLMIFATPAKTIQTYATIARLGWKPAHIFVNSVSAAQVFITPQFRRPVRPTVNGSISTYYTKDPANPAWDNDPGMKLYRQIMKKYYPSGNDKDANYLYGMAKGWTIVQALYKAGKNPTRESLMNAVNHLNDSTNPWLLPKVVVKTNAPKDNFPISQQELIQFDNGGWTPISGLIDTRPRG